MVTETEPGAATIMVTDPETARATVPAGGEPAAAMPSMIMSASPMTSGMIRP